jgi:hypothetical protein
VTGKPRRNGDPPAAADTALLGHHVQDLLIRGVEGLLRVLPEGRHGPGGWTGMGGGSVLRIRAGSWRRTCAGPFRRREDRVDRAGPPRPRTPTSGARGWPSSGMGALGPGRCGSGPRWRGSNTSGGPLAQGRGVILLTGHLGNWEIGGAALAVREIPMDVVARRQNNPLFDARLNRTRERWGCGWWIGTGSTKTSSGPLRSGRVVALVADQNVFRRGLRGLLRVPASTARGPELLAERTGAAVVFATAIRLPGLRARYRVLRPLLPAPGTHPRARRGRPTGVPPGTTSRRWRRASAGPEQYLWAHKRWKTRPDPGGRRRGGTARGDGTTGSSGTPAAPGIRDPEGGPAAPTDFPNSRTPTGDLP